MLSFKEFEPSTVPKKAGTLQGLSTLFEEKVESLPKEMVTLAEEYGEEKRSISAAENKVKRRKEELLKKEEKLFAMFEAVGITTFGTGAWTYYTKVDSYPSIAVEQKAFKWIKGEGFGHTVKLSVNLQTLRSMIKEVFDVTGEIPGDNDGIDIKTVNRVGVRKR